MCAPRTIHFLAELVRQKMLYCTVSYQQCGVSGMGCGHGSLFKQWAEARPTAKSKKTTKIYGCKYNIAFAHLLLVPYKLYVPG
jgi:hypothetical protein